MRLAAASLRRNHLANVFAHARIMDGGERQARVQLRADGDNDQRRRHAPFLDSLDQTSSPRRTSVGDGADTYCARRAVPQRRNTSGLGDRWSDFSGQLVNRAMPTLLRLSLGRLRHTLKFEDANMGRSSMVNTGICKLNRRRCEQHRRHGKATRPRSITRTTFLVTIYSTDFSVLEVGRNFNPLKRSFVNAGLIAVLASRARFLSRRHCERPR